MRKSDVLIKYNEVDATKAIGRMMESFTWTDYASGSADTVSLSLNNMNNLWVKKGYIPLHTDRLKAWIRVTDWNCAGDTRSVFCGQFQAITLHIKVNIFFFESRQLGFHHKLVALIPNVNLAGAPASSSEKVVFKIMKCIQ